MASQNTLRFAKNFHPVSEDFKLASTGSQVGRILAKKEAYDFTITTNALIG